MVQYLVQNTGLLAPIHLLMTEACNSTEFRSVIFNKVGQHIQKGLGPFQAPSIQIQTACWVQLLANFYLVWFLVFPMVMGDQ